MNRKLATLSVKYALIL